MAKKILEGEKARKALEKGVNVNDILEQLIDKYLKGEIKLDNGSK